MLRRDRPQPPLPARIQALQRALREYGYHRDGKRGKLQMRLFAGGRSVWRPHDHVHRSRRQVLGNLCRQAKARAYFEPPRRTPRHGPRRVRSGLSRALYRRADARGYQRARRRFAPIVARLAGGRGVPLPPVFPP